MRTTTACQVNTLGPDLVAHQMIPRGIVTARKNAVWVYVLGTSYACRVFEANTFQVPMVNWCTCLTDGRTRRARLFVSCSLANRKMRLCSLSPWPGSNREMRIAQFTAAHPPISTLRRAVDTFHAGWGNRSEYVNSTVHQDRSKPILDRVSRRLWTYSAFGFPNSATRRRQISASISNMRFRLVPTP